MTIEKRKQGGELEIALSGRLDTNTAPGLEVELRRSIGGVSTLVLDLAQLEYISSAGLRVLLAAQKVMNKQGTMIVRNACKDVMEIFDITGFSDFLTIE